MKKSDILFYTFLLIFVATAILTLLGITKVIEIESLYLNVLVGAFLIELAGTVIGFTRFIDLSDKNVPVESLSFAIETFDKLSDELEAVINNQPIQDNSGGHSFIIRRSPQGIAAYQRMGIITADQINKLPDNERKIIRSYEKAMKNFEAEWHKTKRKQVASQIDAERVRNEQIDLIRKMKDELVGIIDFLQSKGLYLDDHYMHIRHLVSTV